jgi:8-oxo-dGTP pyrophosphatase MutT (NUDIX family)
MTGSTPPVADRPEQWPVAESVDLHRDDWVVALRADYIRRPDHPDDEPFKRLVLEHPGAVVILAVDDDERVFCLSQYRHAAGVRFIELPAGLIDQEGEDPEEVGRRELREEAQLEAGEWTHLASAYASPGVSAERVHYFLARDLREVDRGDFDPEHEEADMTTAWVPFAELRAGVLDGRLTDNPTILALLLAQARGLVGAGASGE